MHANLLIVDHQNTTPSRKPVQNKELGKELDKGLIEEDQEQGRGEKDFSATLVEVENEQRSHPGPVDESNVERKESETGEVKSEDLGKDASGETESEDVEEGANMGLAKAGNTSPFLVLEGKAGAGSENGHVVEEEELPAKLKVIKKAVAGLNQADQTLSIDPDKANASRTGPTESGPERKQGEAEAEKVKATTPRGVEKAAKLDGLLRAMSATAEPKGKEASEVVATPRGVEKVEKSEGLLRAMSATAEPKGKEAPEAATTPRGVEKAEKTEGLLRAMSATAEPKGKEAPEAATPPRGLEKAGNTLMDLREEMGRTNRVEHDKEPAAQKLRMGSVQGPPEESVRKEPGIEAATPRLGLDSKDARSETVKIKVSEGDLTHKKVEKAEPGNGENSNLSSRNFSTPHKGAGAISQPKEPRTFTKSAQADTLRQIVNKAALNVGNGRSEFKIDLKPESLGHLKMQILTENNQVTVRVLAENPLVKDMIESNLAQLKANFQNQGLEIEKFDVSVARDSDQNGTGDGRYGSKGRRAKSGDPKNGYDGKVGESEETDVWARRGQGAVNFFA